MKWILVFFIGSVPGTDQVDLYAFPNSPFTSKEECNYVVATNYADLQLKVNDRYDTKDIVYPAACVSERDFYDAVGNPS